MENKKETKISLSTFLLILAIIGLIVMGVFIFKMSNDKAAEEKKSSELQAQLNTLSGTVNELQGKINKETEKTNTTNKTVTENTQNTTNKNSTNITSENKTAKEYTENELAVMARKYYERKNGNNQVHVTVEGPIENGMITIKLYEDHDDHVATIDRYTVSTKTAKGTDNMGNSIDLNN